MRFRRCQAFICIRIYSHKRIRVANHSLQTCNVGRNCADINFELNLRFILEKAKEILVYSWSLVPMAKKNSDLNLGLISSLHESLRLCQVAPLTYQMRIVRATN